MIAHVMPDPTLTVSLWLKARTAITAICGTQVAPWLTGTYPAIRLTDVGPRDRGPEEARNRVQVECWADDYNVASLLARTVEAEINTARGQWGQAWCSGAGVILGPLASPDSETGRHRHLLDIELWLYPL